VVREIRGALGVEGGITLEQFRDARCIVRRRAGEIPA
jgi:hypothetical protein